MLLQCNCNDALLLLDPFSFPFIGKSALDVLWFLVDPVHPCKFGSPPIKLLRRLQLAFVQQNHNLCSLANASRPYIVNGRLVAKAREKVAALMVKERQAGDRFLGNHSLFVYFWLA